MSLAHFRSFQFDCLRVNTQQNLAYIPYTAQIKTSFFFFFFLNYVIIIMATRSTATSKSLNLVVQQSSFHQRVLLARTITTEPVCTFSDGPGPCVPLTGSPGGPAVVDQPVIAARPTFCSLCDNLPLIVSSTCRRPSPLPSAL